jgi:hypothetical protein
MLITPGYVALLRDLHAQPRGFGASGRKHVDAVLAFAAETGSLSILDYGCGQGTLGAALRAKGWGGKLHEYDPAVPGKEALPEPADLVVCSDVLEHVEPDHLEAVLGHIRSLARRAAYLYVSTQPAHKVLGDGRNAHLIVAAPEWWRARICWDIACNTWRWLLVRSSIRENADGVADVTFWLVPND